MEWQEFLDRYVNNHEEFVFKYKDIKIELLYAPKGDGFSVYLVKNKKVIDEKIYSLPQKLLSDFKINGKLIIDIWDDLEWK
ncbi:hypothetical protein [Haloplasma contractile]|uniref:Uncharacterized protein n=1 Tax=Haloplasma contractile SSD-17B TaxID=1033810 RepID=F7PUG8_9MOLU|nr:hypothetical protein [Haloplasma contractile]ERJ11758.1 hypothetical protein HLPCO_002241 [Haloplasma contractile SSD-17B]